MADIIKRNIRIFSVIENLSDAGLSESDTETSCTDAVCSIAARGDVLKLSYTEQTESGKADSDILIYPNHVSVMRRGAVVSNMRFEEGLVHKFLYSIPPYSFDAEIFTKKIRSSMTENGGRLDIFYTMRIGGQDKAVRMKIECMERADGAC